MSMRPSPTRSRISSATDLAGEPFFARSLMSSRRERSAENGAGVVATPIETAIASKVTAYLILVCLHPIATANSVLVLASEFVCIHLDGIYHTRNACRRITERIKSTPSQKCHGNRDALASAWSRAEFVADRSRSSCVDEN